MALQFLPGVIAAGKLALQAEATRQATGFVSKIFGGNGGPNIARSLSKQVGFTVLQSDAARVRDALSRGIDPRTGIPTNPGVQTRTTGIGATFANILTGVTASLLPKVGFSLTNREIDDIINRPATGTPPPLTLPNPVNLPTVSGKVLRTPALPRTTPAMDFPRRVPVSPPGGGKVSLIPSAGMSSVGALARMGGRGLMRTSTGRISRIMLPSGQSFSRKNAASLIRRVGFEAAAVALGITIVEAAELLLADSQTRRRGKGITAAALRNAKATTCRVRTAARVLGIKSTAAPRRKPSCR